MKFKCAVIVAVLIVSSSVEAQRRAGGSIQRAGGGARVNREVANTSIRNNQTVNRNVDRNRDINRNVNVDRDIDRDLDIHRDIDVDVNYDRWGHPVARGVAAGLAFGATVAMLPSTGCSTVVVGGIGYSQCGSTWYQPYYSGTTVQYVVVTPPKN
ncbi:MAG TPA: hypothetical protein VE422_39185 [Terriglobia bacterium]|nr:hypothetical protein [Terriglobia bacterium]